MSCLKLVTLFTLLTNCVPYALGYKPSAMWTECESDNYHEYTDCTELQAQCNPVQPVSCVYFKDDINVIEYVSAFSSLKDVTARLVSHMSDSRFNNNTDQFIKTQEFINYFKTADASYSIMIDTLYKLKYDLDLIAEEHYDWMLVITGYVINREPYFPLLSSN